jgi:hypothetical protein
MKHLVCLHPEPNFLTRGKVYLAMESSYSQIEEYYVVDDTITQHWYPKLLFREATKEEIENFKN